MCVSIENGSAGHAKKENTYICGRWALLPSFAEHGYQLLFMYI